VAQAAPSPMLTTVERLSRKTELIFAIGIVALMVAVYAKEPLEFNAFPSLLLITTMMRLGLNVASTRLILLTGDGGSVIETFGKFVVGGNFVVGVVIFLILLIIQLVVVTKGAGRISEVAARFVLDAMPGKQMAIDADLNAGLISEKDARQRREKVAAEAEFYGAMDGASKFVKGDAIAGLIITIINITAGFIIGMTMMNMTAGMALETFAILTIGDGLVSQIPSLMVTIASGLLVTKARTQDTVGTELAREFFVKPKAIIVAAGMVLFLGLIPGMPFFAFALLAGGMFAIWRMVKDNDQEIAQVEAKKEEEAEKRPEEKVEDMLTCDRMGVEIGYRLIPLVDKARGGTLLERITTLRKQLARELGLLIPPIRIKDNIQLAPIAYRVLLHGQAIATYELHADRLLAIDGGGISTPVHGIATKEPAFGLDAVWIENGRRSEAEAAGYTVTDPASVFITHLTQVLKQHAAQILSREDVQTMLTSLKRDAPVLVKDIETNAKIGSVQKALAALLEERVPINNLEKILETVADQPTADPLTMAEQARSRIGRNIISPYLDNQGKLHAIILDPMTEQRLSQALLSANNGGGLGIAPAEASTLVDQLGKTAQESLSGGRDPVLLTTATLRRNLRQITSRFYPEIAVLSYSELSPGIQVDVVGTIKLGS
jgi:flagellar biosynthesis protein FlhA